jgi:hypothetical protein
MKQSPDSPDVSRLQGRYPLSRVGEPEEVARAVWFFLDQGRPTLPADLLFAVVYRSNLWPSVLPRKGYPLGFLELGYSSPGTGDIFLALIPAAQAAHSSGF